MVNIAEVSHTHARYAVAKETELILIFQFGIRYFAVPWYSSGLLNELVK